MGRTKKTESDDSLNERIGARLASHRSSRGWSLGTLAERLGMSVAHLSSLESGRYTFSAALLVKIARSFGEPVSAFLGPDPPRESMALEWQSLLDTLTQRDRVILFDLARKLSSWSETFMSHASRRNGSSGGCFISLEGIDGVLLHDLGARLKAGFRKGQNAEVCSYDYQTGLFRYMMQRFEELDVNDRDAFERTLLFACERLHRQEVMIRPMLAEGKTVLTPFFTMAPTVYQEMEGVNDRRVTDIMAAMLLQPDRIIVVQSDPHVAARRAVRTPPLPGQFYSPYERVEDFERAMLLHTKAIEEFTARGYEVRVIRIDGDTITKDIESTIERMVFAPTVGGSA